MSTTSMDDLNEISRNDVTMMRDILSGNKDDDDENGNNEDADDNNYEDGVGIDIPKHVTPVNEVEEFFRVHLVDANNKAKEKSLMNNMRLGCQSRVWILPLAVLLLFLRAGQPPEVGNIH